MVIAGSKGSEKSSLTSNIPVIDPDAIEREIFPAKPELAAGRQAIKQA
jgi:predicted ABC-type ATPase